MTQLALLGADAESPFDAIKRTDERGEFWTGRDLQPLMEYARWDAFEAVIVKARNALLLIEGAESASSNFLHMEGNRSKPGRPGSDYRLTRFGAYLTCMAGDETKRAVAQGRIYFAVKTRQAEVAERDTNPRHAIPQSFADALQLAADQAREIERQGQQIAELEPKAQQAEHYRAARGLTAIGTFASDLQVWAKENHGVTILHEQVRDFMAELGLLIRGNTIRNNEPTADAQKRGLMRIKNSTFERGEGEYGSGRSARLTQKGCGYVWDRAVKRIAAHGSLKPSTDIESTSPRS